MLILDDLHWAALPSLLMLRHLVRHDPSMPLLVVATYRDTELNDSDPLAELLADLRREHGIERLELSGLSEDDIGRLVRSAGQRLGDPRALEIGLRLLGWLLDVEVWDGHLSPTPTHGWSRGEPRPAFDQQPIEAAAIADACVRAFSLTSDARWNEGLRLAIGWFLGDNDSTVDLIDPETGGASDGLGPAGCSLNQGAASTLALISTLQHGRNARVSTHVR